MVWGRNSRGRRSRLLPWCTKNGMLGREPGDLPLPVAQQGRGADEQGGRAHRRLALLAVQQQGQHLDGLTRLSLGDLPGEDPGQFQVPFLPVMDQPGGDCHPLSFLEVPGPAFQTQQTMASGEQGRVPIFQFDLADGFADPLAVQALDFPRLNAPLGFIQGIHVQGCAGYGPFTFAIGEDGSGMALPELGDGSQSAVDHHLGIGSDALAQAHIVRQDAAQPQAVEPVQPGQAAQLVRAAAGP